MNEMFEDCSSSRLHIIDVSHFDTSQVTDMSHMFDSCFSYFSVSGGTLDLSNWDTSQVTNMSYMFNDCKYLDAIRLSEKFKTSRVIDMSYMFDENECLTFDHPERDYIEHWDVSNVINMDFMFYRSRLVYLDLGGWNVSKVKSHDSFRFFNVILTEPNWP